MSEAIQKIEALAGMPIGKLGEPRQPFLEAVKETTSIEPHRWWVAHARAGRTSGRHLLPVLDFAVADPNDSSKKDYLYSTIANEIARLRLRIPIHKSYPRRYLSLGLTEKAAGKLELNTQSVRKAIRAMRSDLAFGYEEDSLPILEDLFAEATSDFFVDTIDKMSSSDRLTGAPKLRDKWDGKSLPIFYKLMYAVLQGKGIGVWTSYESGVMQYFYDRRVGSTSSPTDFDKEVLSLKGESDYSRVVADVKERTGILIDEHVLVQHRNALVYGDLTATKRVNEKF